jgi:hypothetical protein
MAATCLAEQVLPGLVKQVRKQILTLSIQSTSR